MAIKVFAAQRVQKVHADLLVSQVRKDKLVQWDLVDLLGIRVLKDL